MLCPTDMIGLSIKASIRSNFSDLEVRVARSQPCEGHISRRKSGKVAKLIIRYDSYWFILTN